MRVAETYLRAVNSKNLRVDETHSDTDRLIAAGWVSSGSDRKALALTLQRWMAGDLRGMQQTVELMVDWIKSGTRIGKPELTRMPRTEAMDIAKAVCAWWMHQTCPSCGGHGHPVMAGAPVLDTSRECVPCSGTGRRNLTAGMTDVQALVANGLVVMLEGVTPVVFGEMARRLRQDMDL